MVVAVIGRVVVDVIGEVVKIATQNGKRELCRFAAYQKPLKAVKR